jgi:hypothetical protein
MPRYSIAGRSTVVGTSLRAMASLYAIAAVGGKVREVGVFNTTTTALAVALVRFTNATNVGGGLTEASYDPATPTPSCTGFAGHTGDGGTGQVIRQASIGAAIGAGVIWTFGDTGLVIAVGTANGIGITCPTGTGQICDYYIDWDE